MTKGQNVGGELTAKLTSKGRLQNALEFLRDYQESMRRAAPTGEGDKWADACWWLPREPAYSWRTAYGDFDPATLRAGVARGLIERQSPNRHAYRITADGRAASIPAGHELCACGRLTHSDEAACLHCGRTKEWAQPTAALSTSKAQLQEGETPLVSPEANRAAAERDRERGAFGPDIGRLLVGVPLEDSKLYTLEELDAERGFVLSDVTPQSPDREKIAERIKQWFLEHTETSSENWPNNPFCIAWIDCGEVDFRDVADSIISTFTSDRAGIPAADAFEMGYVWRGHLMGQTLEDSRAVGRTLTSDTFAGLNINLEGFNSFETADFGIVDAKRRIKAALSAAPSPSGALAGGWLPIESAPIKRAIMLGAATWDNPLIDVFFHSEEDKRMRLERWGDPPTHWTEPPRFPRLPSPPEGGQ